MSTIEISSSSKNTSPELTSPYREELPTEGSKLDQRGRVRPREELGKDIVEPPTKKLPLDLEQPPPGFQLFPLSTERDRGQKNGSQKGGDTSVSLQKCYDSLLAIHTMVTEEKNRLLFQRDNWLLERASLNQQISQLRQGVSPLFSNQQTPFVRVEQGPVYSTVPRSGSFRNLECTEVEVKLIVTVPTPTRPSTNTRTVPPTPRNSPEIQL